MTTTEQRLGLALDAYLNSKRELTMLALRRLIELIDELVPAATRLHVDETDQDYSGRLTYDRATDDTDTDVPDVEGQEVGAAEMGDLFMEPLDILDDSSKGIWGEFWTQTGGNRDSNIGWLDLAAIKAALGDPSPTVTEATIAVATAMDGTAGRSMREVAAAIRSAGAEDGVPAYLSPDPVATLIERLVDAELLEDRTMRRIERGLGKTWPVPAPDAATVQITPDPDPDYDYDPTTQRLCATCDEVVPLDGSHPEEEQVLGGWQHVLDDVEVPVKLLFRAPAGTDYARLREAVESILEFSSARDAFQEGLAGARDDIATVEYDGYGIEPYFDRGVLVLRLGENDVRYEDLLAELGGNTVTITTTDHEVVTLARFEWDSADDGTEVCQGQELDENDQPTGVLREFDVIGIEQIEVH